MIYILIVWICHNTPAIVRVGEFYSKAECISGGQLFVDNMKYGSVGNFVCIEKSNKSKIAKDEK